MNTQMVRGDKYTQKLYEGQRIHSILYGGRDGVIIKINGEQQPESIKHFSGVSMGGRAYINVVFDNGTVSNMIPESIIRGVQWYITDAFDIATQDEIKSMLAFAEAEKIKKEESERIRIEKLNQQKTLLPYEYPHLIPMSKDGTAAKNIRIELKKAFPGVKFSVRSDHGSVRVSWSDGPKYDAVQKLIDRHAEGDFDGMTDSYNYDYNNAFAQVFGGSRYLFANRTISPALTLKAAQELGYTLTPENIDQYGSICGLGIEDSQRIYRHSRGMEG